MLTEKFLIKLYKVPDADARSASLNSCQFYQVTVPGRFQTVHVIDSWTFT
jgi:hypothetical protein